MQSQSKQIGGNWNSHVSYGNHQGKDHRDTCPECGEKQGIPTLLPCECPTMIAIPTGQHIHVSCPRHGRVTLRGPNYHL